MMPAHLMLSTPSTPTIRTAQTRRRRVVEHEDIRRRDAVLNVITQRPPTHRHCAPSEDCRAGAPLSLLGETLADVTAYLPTPRGTR